MKNTIFTTCVILALVAGAARLSSQMPTSNSAIEMNGVKAAMRLQVPVEGFLSAINGKLDLRASEITFEPGGSLKDHYHFGPGIRHVIAGQLTLVDTQSGKEQVVRAGEFFYESGARLHTAMNRGREPVKVVVVELVPAGLKGAAMVPTSRRPELERSGYQLKTALCSTR